MHIVRSNLVLVALLASSAACSQGVAPPPSASGMTLDAFLARQTARLMAADTDGDGRISRAEMSAAAKGGHDPSRRFDRMDTNHDGYLDAGEIRAGLTRRFQRLDRNGDGVVTPDERMAGRQGHGQPGPSDATPPDPQP